MHFEFARVSGNGPFERFWLTTDAGLSMKVEWTDPTYVDIDEVRYLEADLGLVYDAPEGIYYVGAGDFGGGNLVLFTDDEGMAAFATWASDGPTSSGYYRRA